MTIVESYAEAVRTMLLIKGMEIANIANHRALEHGEITLEMFQAGARVLAEEILKR